MEVKEAIKTRRSIRKFQSKEVPDDLIKELVEAARLAPSAYNAQPSKFVIVKSEATKQKLKDGEIFKQNFVCLAPLIIICLADPGVFPKERFEPTFSKPKEIGGDMGAVVRVLVMGRHKFTHAMGRVQTT